MSLSTDDFAVAYRALTSKACTLKALQKAFKMQASRIEKGRHVPLRELLVTERFLPEGHAALTGSDHLSVRSDPAALESLGELLLLLEVAHEYELDQVVDELAAGPDPRKLPDVEIPKSLAKYDLAWEVGRGRDGAVFRGMRREGHSIVAIKVFRPEVFAGERERKAFLERVTASAAARHESSSFVRVYESGEASVRFASGEVPTAYIVMEFIEGPTLAAMIADRKVSLRRGFEIVERAARALAGAHAKGEAHDQLSGSSILVTGDDRPHIAEFGWRPGGTPAQDVFALGGLLYEIAAGVAPYGGFRARDLKPPSRYNPQVAGAAERVILKAVARNPARRYADAGALADDIARYLRREDVAADVTAEESAAPPPAPAKRSRAPWIVAGSLAGAALLALTVWMVRGNRKADESSEEASAPAVSWREPQGSAISNGPAPSPPKKRRTRPPVDPRREEIAKKGPMKRRDEWDYRYAATGAIAEQNFDELERLAEEALIRGPERDWAHHWMAMAAREKGELDRALKHADRAIELGSQDPDLIQMRFDIYLARSEFRKVLYEMGTLYPKGIPQVNDEILRLNRQIETEPRDARLYLRRGALYHHRKHYPKAIEDFTMAVALGESRAHYFRGLTLMAEDRSEEAADAIQAFLAAHGSGPGADEARLALAEIEK
ncbi:MAG: hypothetical protein HY716_14295 [Planctomycetes bacterium]|nr:hypothetical protein [Planctomycetota bacterium]